MGDRSGADGQGLEKMTFYNRLRLFFTIIVLIPMLAIAAVLFALTGDSERGKADAGIATAVGVGLSELREGRAAATALVRRLAADDGLSRALSERDPAVARARLDGFERSHPAIVSATLRGPDGEPLAQLGAARSVGAARAVILDGSGGPRLGSLTVSVTDARRLVESTAERTGLEVAVQRGGETVASTVPGVGAVPREASDFEVDGRDYRGRRVTAGGAGGAADELAVFREAGTLHSAITKSRLLIGAIIAAFLLLALATSVFVVRALQGQIGQFLEAARRLAGGRFDQRVPTEGRDEFAQLGREFNSMSDQLRAKIGEVEGKRRELEETIRRVGKAFASGLDGQGMLELAVQTALQACGAESARTLPLHPRALQEFRAGASNPRLLAAMGEADRVALAEGPQRLQEPSPPAYGLGQTRSRPRLVATEHDGVHALAVPLRASLGSQTSSSYLGVVSIARAGEPFAREEAELLEYLVGQAVISIENADLHAMLQLQAVTDELTGLSNLREMHRALEREFERHSRFDSPFGFVLLDLDDFKAINDSFGHLQGNEVLMGVATALRELTRDIDDLARYGGEELAVVLPQTDLDGAALLAERMREAIEQLRVPRLDNGEELSVTASFGVAAVPDSAADLEGLIAATDAALYRAKRAGKNRIERSTPGDAGGGRTSGG
ncbi:MAG: diguanylate cyclase [Thermoleophilaceae bacterium]